jgi:large subunit ribosomal protein L39e
MARHKPTAKKRRLARAATKNKPVPTWVMGRTGGKFRTHPGTGNWRSRKIRA